MCYKRLAHKFITLALLHCIPSLRAWCWAFSCCVSADTFLWVFHTHAWRSSRLSPLFTRPSSLFNSWSLFTKTVLIISVKTACQTTPFLAVRARQVRLLAGIPGCLLSIGELWHVDHAGHLNVLHQCRGVWNKGREHLVESGQLNLLKQC